MLSTLEEFKWDEIRIYILVRKTKYIWMKTVTAIAAYSEACHCKMLSKLGMERTLKSYSQDLLFTFHYAIMCPVESHLISRNLIFYHFSNIWQLCIWKKMALRRPNAECGKEWSDWTWGCKSKEGSHCERDQMAVWFDSSKPGYAIQFLCGKIRFLTFLCSFSLSPEQELTILSL